MRVRVVRVSERERGWVRIDVGRVRVTVSLDPFQHHDLTTPTPTPTTPPSSPVPHPPQPHDPYLAAVPPSNPLQLSTTISRVMTTTPHPSRTLLLASLSQPASSSNLRHPSLPFCAASIKAVHPDCEMGDGQSRRGAREGEREGGREGSGGVWECRGSPIEDQRMCSTDGHINGYFERIPNGRVSEDEGEGEGGKGE